MSFLDEIVQLILNVGRIFEAVEQTVTDGTQLVENIRLEARHLKEIKFDPKWKTRVINVPIAVSTTHDMVTELVGQVEDAFHSLVANLRAIKNQWDPTIPGEKGHGVIKILDDLGKTRAFILELDNAFKSLSTFVDSLRRVREEFETLDSLFLPQGNSRRSEKLVAGGSIRVRIGALHD